MAHQGKLAMKQRNSTRNIAPRCSSHFQVRQLAAIVILVVGVSCSAWASCPRFGLPSNSPFGPKESVADLNPDLKNDMHAAQKYEKAVQKLLNEEKFSELDKAADSARATKARFSGGSWTLYVFYSALQEPVRWSS